MDLTVSPNFVTQECQWSFGEVRMLLFSIMIIIIRPFLTCIVQHDAIYFFKLMFFYIETTSTRRWSFISKRMFSWMSIKESCYANGRWGERRKYCYADAVQLWLSVTWFYFFSMLLLLFIHSHAMWIGSVMVLSYH